MANMNTPANGSQLTIASIDLESPEAGFLGATSPPSLEIKRLSLPRLSTPLPIQITYGELEKDGDEMALPDLEFTHA